MVDNAHFVSFYFPFIPSPFKPTSAPPPTTNNCNMQNHGSPPPPAHMPNHGSPPRPAHTTGAMNESAPARQRFRRPSPAQQLGEYIEFETTGWHLRLNQGIFAAMWLIAIIKLLVTEMSNRGFSISEELILWYVDSNNACPVTAALTRFEGSTSRGSVQRPACSSPMCSGAPSKHPILLLSKQQPNMR